MTAALLLALALLPAFPAAPATAAPSFLGARGDLTRDRVFGVLPGVKYPVVVRVDGGPTRFPPPGLQGGSPREQPADQGFLVVKVVNRCETHLATRPATADRMAGTGIRAIREHLGAPRP